MKNNTYRWLIMLGVLFFAAVIVVFLIYQMNGQTTVTGKYPDNIEKESLKCYSDTVRYPYFSYDNSNSHKVMTNIVFNNDKLKTISIDYELDYDNPTLVSASESHNHADMNRTFAEHSLSADSFSAHYTRTGNKMIMSLYAKNNDLNNSSLKYFMVSNSSLDSTLEHFKSDYEEQGFACEKK